MIDMDEVISILKSEYEKAEKKIFVIKPFAYALYQTWKIVDRKETHRIKTDV